MSQEPDEKSWSELEERRGQAHGYTSLRSPTPISNQVWGTGEIALPQLLPGGGSSQAQRHQPGLCGTVQRSCSSSVWTKLSQPKVNVTLLTRVL